MTFEQAMARIEEITRQLESGELELAASIALYEEGKRLIAQCDVQLRDAEQKVCTLDELLRAPGDEEGRNA